MRTDQFNVKENHNLLLDSLDLVEERQKVAMVKMAYYQQKLKQRYDKGVKSRPLAPRDLVLRKVVGRPIAFLGASWVLIRKGHIESLPLLVLGLTTWKIWMRM